MAEKQSPMKIFFISLIILFVSVSISAMLDWQVMSHSQYDLNNSVEYIEFENYAFWFGLSMSMPGIAISVVTCAIYWSVKGVRVMLPVAVLACTLILLISGLEDLIYFALGANGFPAANMNWNWLLQSRLFGFWNTTIHVIWTAFWVLFAIPMVSFVLHRKMQRSKSSRL
jgi:hypothetical protein